MRKRGKRIKGVALQFPPSWGLVPDDVAKLNAADELALFKLLAGEAQNEHLCLLEASTATALHSINYAQAAPNTHTLTVESLNAARGLMLQCTAALMNVRERFKATGKIGCSGPEREALKDLVDNIKELRARLTRRVWRVGVGLADAQVPIKVPRAQAGAVAGVAA